MKVALIGYGYWGKIIHRYIEEDANFNLEIIYSPELENKGIFKNDITAILKEDTIEAAFLCTPVETHYNLCKILLTKGKHVFCEKPTVKSVQQFLELERIALENHKCLFSDYIYTVSPSINLLRNLLGEIGEVRYIDCRIMQFGKFYSDADVFEVIGIHMLSVLIYLFPEKRIIKVKYNPNVGADLCVDGTIDIKYDDSSVANIRCSLVYPEKERKISVIGTKGVLLFDMCNKISLRLMKFSNSKEEFTKEYYQEWDINENNNLTNAINAFHECIQKKNSGNLSLSRAVLALLYEHRGI